MSFVLARVKDQNARKVLDHETRLKRQKRQLDSLEKENFHDDPHAHLSSAMFSKAKIPSFEDSMEGKNNPYHIRCANIFAKPKIMC